ncbi:MAG TPA: matrixin family metalloprotease, partial [Terriglobia bacterium]|nr:matrixin family metalloprotease [Terriglobia bacterium]
MQWRKKQRHQAVSESKFRMELIEPRVLLSADILLAPMIATQEESEPASITLVQDSKYEIQFETTPDSSDDSNASKEPSGTVTASDFDSIRGLVDEGVHRLGNLDFSAEQLEKASQVPISIVDLPGWTLAETSEDGIKIDPNADGFGWFIDSTPQDNSEFVEDGNTLRAKEGSDADGRVDLLTVLTHELGHYLGLSHTDGTNESTAFMQSGIRPGIRRLPGDDSIVEGGLAPTSESGNSTIIDQLTETLKAANAPPQNSQLNINPTISWIANTSGFWDVASNWQDTLGVSRVPNATDDVLIDRGASNPTITIRTAQSVRSLLANETLVVSSTTLTLGADSELDASSSFTNSTINGPGTLTNVGTLTLQNVTMNAPLVNQGVMVVRGSSNATNGTFTTTPGSILQLQGDGSFDQAILNVNG